MKGCRSICIKTRQNAVVSLGSTLSLLGVSCLSSHMVCLMDDCFCLTCRWGNVSGISRNNILMDPKSGRNDSWGNRSMYKLNFHVWASTPLWRLSLDEYAGSILEANIHDECILVFYAGVLSKLLSGAFSRMECRFAISHNHWQIAISVFSSSLSFIARYQIYAWS